MSAPFDPEKYRKGYSLGVGGVVLKDDKALLIRSAQGRNAGEWAIPGGFVESDETIDIAAKREIFEEAGIQVDLLGLIAARNRVMQGENSAYFVFLMQAKDDSLQSDGVEVDAAQYFTLAEIQRLPKLNALSKALVTQVLEGQHQLLSFQAHPTIPPSEYVLYI